MSGLTGQLESPRLQLQRGSRPARRRALQPVSLLVNGNASGRPTTGAIRDLARAIRRRGATLDVHVTTSLEELAAAWPDDPEQRVVLVGGDGTVHAVANLAASPRDVALIPAGEANNVARSLGIPLDWARRSISR